MKCVLCDSLSIHKWHEDKRRPYYQCENCSLIFVPRNFLLTPEKEKARYDTHKNSDTDLLYREYLTKITTGMHPYLPEKAKGLDFGCGRSTLLADLLIELEFSVDSYDLFYHLHEKIWNDKYDFIILSEVIEHLSSPLEIMMKLKHLLTPQGQFFIKTKYYPAENKQFNNWFYKNDPTHVQFFSEKSMRWLASSLNMNEPQELMATDLIRIWF